MTTKLLAVDDSKTMQKVLEITFAGDTFDSKIVGSADEALGAVRAFAPQIAIVDGHLGGASGYDLCKQIKTEAPEVRVLLLSSKQRPYDEAQGSAAGVDGHFDKPFDSTKFLDKVAELVANAPVLTAAPMPDTSASAPLQRPQAPPARISEAPAIARTPVVTPSAPPAAMKKQPIAAASSRPARAASVPASMAAVARANGGMADKLEGLGLTSEQIQGVLSLSREVVEQVVWEVVPTLAETLIKEEIARLTSQ